MVNSLYKNNACLFEKIIWHTKVLHKKHAEFSILNLAVYVLAGGKIETNEMGRACGAYGGG